MFGTVFNATDIAALVIVFLALLLGLHRKLSGEIAPFIGLALTLTLGLRFYRPLGGWLAAHTRLEEVETAHATAFLAIVALVMLAVLLLRLLLALLVKIAFNEKIERTGGGIVGGLRGVLLVVLLVIAVGLWPHAYLRGLVVEHALVGRAIFQYVPTLERLAVRPFAGAAASDAPDESEEDAPPPPAKAARRSRAPTPEEIP